MRIGIIILELNNGGSSYQLINFAKQLQNKNNEVIIYVLKDNLSKINPLITNGLKIKTAIFNPINPKNHSQSIGFAIYLLNMFKASFALYNLIKKDKNNLDIINPHDFYSNWPAVYIRLRFGIPVVFLCNDVWFITGFEPSPENRIIFKLGNKYIINVFDKIFTNFVDKIIVLDNRIKKIIQKQYGIEPVVIRSGIELSDYQNIPSKEYSRSKLGIDNKYFIFLCLAIFLPHRRFEDAIVAFSEFKKKYKNKAQLLIVGSDSYDKNYSNSIKELIKKNNLVKFVDLRLGYLNDKEKIKYFKASDVYLFPNDKQTWGLTVVEAMACKLPCIISDGSGVHEVITNSETGLIFKARDVNMLLSKMEELYLNKKLKENIGKNARNFVFNNYSWEKFSDTAYDVFTNIIK